jgi:CTP:phosphocholine cytidylyltransferase-like protein
MRDFRLRSILAIIFAFTFQSNSYAKDGIYGCWNNIHQIKVDPKYSPLHENTTANGEIICFKKNGAITTVHVGGFEALGTEGKFYFSAGRLTLIKKELADGWPFAFKIDHCNVNVISDQLTISGCKGGGNLVLDKQTNSPDLNGVAGGVSQ